jgi:hypothetical protein
LENFQLKNFGNRCCTVFIDTRNLYKYAFRLIKPIVSDGQSINKATGLSLITISLTALCVCLAQPVKAESQPPITEWSKTYAGQEAYAVIQTADGGYVIAGMNATLADRGYSYFLPMVIKTNSLGEEMWQSQSSQHG